MSSLRGKILTTYGFSKVILLVFAIVVFADLYYLQTRIVAGEAVNAFREASQEMRRDEKNLFLYHDLASLDQLLLQFDVAETALESGRHAFEKIAAPGELGRVSQMLQAYLMSSCSKTLNSIPTDIPSKTVQYCFSGNNPRPF